MTAPSGRDGKLLSGPGPTWLTDLEHTPAGRLSQDENPRPHRPQSHKLMMRQLNGGQAPKLGGAINSPTVTILQLGVGVKSEYQRG